MLSVNKLLWGCLCVARLLQTQDDRVVGNHKRMCVLIIIVRVDGAISVSLCIHVPSSHNNTMLMLGGNDMFGNQK